jgi:hypothetical protein
LKVGDWVGIFNERYLSLSMKVFQVQDACAFRMEQGAHATHLPHICPSFHIAKSSKCSTNIEVGIMRLWWDFYIT